MCEFCNANSKGEILSGKPVRTYEWQKTAGYEPPEKRNDFLEMFILKNKDDKKAGLMVDSGYGYRWVDIDYCPFCRKEVGRVSTEKPIERPIELLRKISKEIYDNEFYIETAILSYQAQEEKTYTFFRDDEQKDELRKYSWCQRPDSTNMSLKRFAENGEIEGYMSESLAEHYGLQKVDLNEFIHKFVKPLVKYKFEEDKQ